MILYCSIFPVPERASMMDAKLPQYPAAQKRMEAGRISVSVVVFAQPLLSHFIGTISMTQYLSVIISHRSLSNQYQNENSSFHAKDCTVFRGSLGEPETNFLTFCLWYNIVYYYYSNH